MLLWEARSRAMPLAGLHKKRHRGRGRFSQNHVLLGVWEARSRAMLFAGDQRRSIAAEAASHKGKRILLWEARLRAMLSLQCSRRSIAAEAASHRGTCLCA